MNRNYLRQILLSATNLLITSEGYSAAMIECFPPVAAANTPTSFFNQNPPTYKENSAKLLAELKAQYIGAEMEGVNLTDDYASPELPDLSIAYYRIFGFITSSCRWYFSTKQFEQDLLAAEANAAISCHFLHVNSPGGEAWYLDRLSETMRTLQKPVFVLIEQICGSAAYYISCHGNNIQALTLNDQVGCIGTMTDFWDFTGYYEQLGLKHVVIKADQSDLKNKKFEDARKGKTEQYRKELLNPLAEQFINEVRDNRPQIKDLPDTDPIIRGETFDTTASIANGLIDGSMTFTAAVQTALNMAREYSGNTTKNRALTFLK